MKSSPLHIGQPFPPHLKQETKVNQAKKFLSKGDKLKISIRLRGREMAHSDIGVANMERFVESLGEDVNVDKAPKLEGRQILMFVSPKQSK